MLGLWYGEDGGEVGHRWQFVISALSFIEGFDFWLEFNFDFVFCIVEMNWFCYPDEVLSHL